MKTDMGRWVDLSLGNDKKQEESWWNRPEAAGALRALGIHGEEKEKMHFGGKRGTSQEKSEIFI